MNENLKAFMQKASEDEELGNKLMEMSDSIYEDSKKRLIKLAEENGYSFTVADIDELYAEIPEISEDELETVVGGAYTKRDDQGRLRSNCFCAIGGGGSKDALQKTCGCFMGGCGKLTDLGKEKADRNEIHWEGKSYAKVATYCIMGGGYKW